MQNKDVGYLENQQQNIADAIDLLPRLATGIDVNIKFRRLVYAFLLITGVIDFSSLVLIIMYIKLQDRRF